MLLLERENKIRLLVNDVENYSLKDILELARVTKKKDLEDKSDDAINELWNNSLGQN